MENSAEELKEFTFIVSHDLSAPLRAIIEFSKILKDEQFHVLNNDGKEYLSLIIKSGEKMQNMLSDLLDYSRINTIAKALSEVNCNSMLDDCKTSLKEQIASTKGKLETDSLPVIKADSEQIKRLFVILLSNALKFHVPGNIPRVLISAEKKEKDWMFTVQDNGIGIKQEFYKKVFQPFQRLHADSEYPGNGMGLTLAKKIVESHGGSIWVEPAKEQGCAFKFTLPCHDLN